MRWAESLGGLTALVARTHANMRIVEDWVEHSAWAGFLAEDAESRSPTSVCLKIVDPWFAGLAAEEQAAAAKRIASTLADEGVAYDIGAYRDAPPGLRIWCGATVETADVEALMPWLDWAYANLKQDAQAAA